MKALSTKQRWGAIVVFAAFATALTFTLIAGPFGYASVCDKCGALRSTADWQLAWTQFTVSTHSTQSDSPLSQVLLTNGIVPAHSHHWLFAHGGGNGVRCAIGPGGYVRSTAKSEEFAALVLALHQRGQTAFRDRVLRGAFDPATSHLFCSLTFSAPKAMKSATEMQDWIAEQSEYLDEMVPAYKNR